MTDSDSRRRTSTEGLRFGASAQLTADLQAVLIDLIELHLQAKQAHWNLVGTNFRDLHRQLDEVVDLARNGADTIAERMRAIQATPDGRSDTVVSTTTLPAFPPGEQATSAIVDLVTGPIAAATTTARAVLDTVGPEDPPSTDLLHTVINDLEKQAWMLSAESATGR